MAVSLTKGEKVNLSKVVERLANVTVGLGWDAAEYGDSIDCDSSVFVLKIVDWKPRQETERQTNFWQK